MLILGQSSSFRPSAVYAQGMRPMLQPAHSAALQPVSSPLPTTFSGNDSDSDSCDGSPAALLSPLTPGADPSQDIDLVQSGVNQVQPAEHSEQIALRGSNDSGHVAASSPAPPASVSAAATDRGQVRYFNLCRQVHPLTLQLYLCKHG